MGASQNLVLIMHCWVLLLCVPKCCLQVWGESWWMVRLQHWLRFKPKFTVRTPFNIPQMWAAVQSDLNPKYHTGYFTGLSTISSVVNLYSIHCKCGWQNLLRKTTNQIDLTATDIMFLLQTVSTSAFPRHFWHLPGSFFSGSWHGCGGFMWHATNNIPGVSVCHTFPQCVMSWVLEDEVFHVAFPSLIPQAFFPNHFRKQWSKVATTGDLADDDSSSETTDKMHHQHESQASLEIYCL